MSDQHPLRFEQHESDPAALKRLEALRAQIDETTVPSGVFVEGPAEGDALDAFDGSEASPVMQPLQWRHAWDLVTRSRVASLAAFDADLDALAEQAGDAVPVVVAELAYEHARPRWGVALDTESPPPLATLVRSGRAFLAGTLLPERAGLFEGRPGCHYGLDVRFVFSGHLGNAVRPATFTLDPGDGEEHPFSAEQPVSFHYDEPGVKTLTLRARDVDGAMLVGRFDVHVKPMAPPPDAIWTTGPGTRDRAYVYYGRPGGRPRTRLEQPVLISDGFPGRRDVHEIWELMNASSFVDSMLDAGKDVVLIGYEDGTKAIEKSADQYVQVIARAIHERVGHAPLVVGGGSMGGLIARCALLKMERGGPAHQTRLFFTVDTPHYGANIATSVQTFLQLYHDHNEDTRPRARDLSSVAAQQMLLYWVPPRSEWKRGQPFEMPSERRKTFLEDLKKLGWMPTRVERKIAVADGRGDRQGNGVAPGAKAFWFECTAFAWADLWAADEKRARVAFLNRGIDRWTVEGGGQRIDGAPGGTTDSWQQLFDGVAGMRRELWHPRHCFVPTTSACGIEGDPYGPVSVERSEFDAIMTSATENHPHVALPVELKNFLLGEIAGVEPTGPVMPMLPVFHPDCLRDGDAIGLHASGDGRVFRRQPAHDDAMIADGTLPQPDGRLIVVREGDVLSLRSWKPLARYLGRVNRRSDGDPFEASKEELNEWTRLTPLRESNRLIRLRADNGLFLTGVSRPMGLRLEAAGSSEQGVFVSLLGHPLKDGDVLALRADNGLFVSRMGETWGRPIAATKQQPDLHCRFVFRYLGNGRVALRNEGTHYVKVLTRNDITRIEAATPELDAYGQFVLEPVGGHRVTLKGVIGGYAQRVDEGNEIRATGPAVGPRSTFELMLLERA